MTQLLGFGTGTVNFFGRYAYVGEGRDGFHAVVWTEPDEPQAAIGSHLQKIAYPANYQKHSTRGSVLEGSVSIIAAQTFRTLSCAANISTPRMARVVSKFSMSRTSIRKDFPNASSARRSRRSGSAPTSTRNMRPASRCRARSRSIRRATRLPENEEQPIDLFYAFVYVSDREEGLVIVNVATLVDGNPDNNFLKESERSFQSRRRVDRRDVLSPRPVIGFT